MHDIDSNSLVYLDTLKDSNYNRRKGLYMENYLINLTKRKNTPKWGYYDVTEDQDYGKNLLVGT